MKPAPFRYVAAESLANALAVKAEHGDDARFLAGGQSLIPAMNFRLAQPAMLVDVNPLRDLDYVRAADDGALRIGALTRTRTLERHALVAERQPLLHEAVPHVAHPQIRNRGTFGGNLAHADPASELPAVLLTLGARLRAQSSRGERWIEAQDFFVGVFTTALRADEMLVEVELPVLPPRSGTCFMEVARRRGDGRRGGGHARQRRRLRPSGPRVLQRRRYPSAQRRRGAGARGRLHRRAADPRRRGGGRARPGSVRQRARQQGVPAPSRGCADPASAADGAREGEPMTTDSTAIVTTVNRKRVERRVGAPPLLSDFRRHELGLTGTHVGCEHGVCGACTIHYDGAPARSCLMLAVQANGHAITTVEALAPDRDRLHPLQEAFREAHGLQCGYCTPGILMTMKAFLEENSSPSEQEVREALSGNLCRCTGYQHIVDAVLLAASRLRGGSRG